MTRNQVTFRDLDAAVRMREIVTALAKEAIEKLRPQEKVGTVQSVDRVSMKASVLVQGDVLPVSLIIPPSCGPFGAGDLVVVSTDIGSMKVERLLFSPILPGGVSIRPGHVAPVEIGLTGFGAVQREQSLAPANSAGDPYFLGRWVLNDTSVYYEAGGGIVGGVIQMLVNVENLITWDFAPDLQTVSGGWKLVTPAAYLDGLNGPQFALEAQTDIDDDGAYFVEVRIRYTGGAGLYSDFPWSVNTTVVGNVTKDQAYTPGITDDPISTTIWVSPALGDTGICAVASPEWDLVGGSGHTISSGSYRIKNGRVEGKLTLTVGSAIAVPSDGNIVNQTFGHVPDWMIPLIDSRFSSMGTGPLSSGYIASADGAIILGAVDSGASLSSGTVISVGFSYDL